MQLPYECKRCQQCGTDVGHGGLETTDNRVLHIMCLTCDEWRTLAIVTLGTIRPEDSGAVFEQKNESLGMPGGKSPRHAQTLVLGE